MSWGMGDRFVLGMYLPLREVGVYLIAGSVAALIKYFPVAFDVAWTPFAYDSMQRSDAQILFARMATYAFAVLAASLVALSGLAPPLMDLMLPAEYRQVGPLVPLLALALAIQTVRTLPGTSLNVAKKTAVYPTVTAAGASISVGAYFALIPRFGTYGAAAAQLISQVLTTALMIYLAQRAYRIPYEVGRMAKVVAVGATTYVAMMTIVSGSSWLNGGSSARPAALVFGRIAAAAFSSSSGACRHSKAALERSTFARTGREHSLSMRIVDDSAIRRHASVRFRSEYDYAVFEYWRSAKVLAYLEKAGITTFDRVLDDGCGGGGMCVSFAEEARSVVGIEPGDRFRNVGTRLAAEKAVSNVRFSYADGTALPFRDGAFDLVLSHSVIEHVANPLEYLKEARRVLAPGGAMLLNTAPYLSSSGSHLPKYKLPFPLPLPSPRPRPPPLPSALLGPQRHPSPPLPRRRPT